MLRNFLCLVAVLFAIFACPLQADNSGIFDVTTPSRVSVHDPSIVIGYKQADGKITGEKTSSSTEVYYIFGSHLGFAKSTDLQNWTTFKNNISTNYKTIFAEDSKWSAKGGTQGSSTGSYDVSGNMWAPDVVWNKKMQKWCMYMSINGDYWYSSIVLLTAETLDGDWTRVGSVVYSGFMTQAEAQQTDFYKVYTGTDLPSRYTLKRNNNVIYAMNCIDPCVFYDEDGNLWMTYGSWFGGLYMLRLDEATGLRDYTYTYETNDGTAAGAISDEYLGLKIAGGNGCSGEASYIQYINGKYYLFVTYGGLTSTGGYNMRVFSSTDVKGPYTDLAGRKAYYTSTNTGVGDLIQNWGTQLMNYYQWSLLGYGYIAEGHNSAIVDDDGKMFLVYHTRATTWGEGHEVRVHQMFVAPNGALVAAPFEYRGETISTSPYTVDEVAGTYKIIYHANTDYANKVCNVEKEITLCADGKVSGAYSGTWTLGTDGPYITIKSNRLGGEMKGVLIKQQMEGLNCETLCFSVVNSMNRPMWGYKSVDDKINEAVADLTGDMPITNVLAKYGINSSFNSAIPVSNISETTGLSLSFYVSGLTSDWDVIGQSTDESYKLYLSVLHYNGADFYEASATPSSDAILLGYRAANLWEAFLNKSCYATVSFNPDGTITYYLDGKLMMTYAANLKPGYPASGSSVTPAGIVKAVINYYLNGQLEFTRSVYNIVVGYSVPYDLEHPAGINAVEMDDDDDDNAPLYNLSGQRVGAGYKGVVVKNGKKYFTK